ncbi:hypothetical protein CRG98_020340 [Punica granatum]|uniref:Uncharacterized protein n=1 Tax=Punica granatum TaxID=22663 RepID=A0A2I0JTN5_PUNGR|nr:hypothetical protein CRG98_020340 [Punica granatum]
MTLLYNTMLSLGAIAFPLFKQPKGQLPVLTKPSIMASWVTELGRSPLSAMSSTNLTALEIFPSVQSPLTREFKRERVGFTRRRQRREGEGQYEAEYEGQAPVGCLLLIIVFVVVVVVVASLSSS